MKSPLADQARRALIDAARRMAPEDRLKAFAEHSRLMLALREAGKRLLRRFPQPPPAR